jgi:hypothetical protein
VSCERCGFTHYQHSRPDGTTVLKLGDVRWCSDNGQRIRLCLGCVADLRRLGHRVYIR